jgi:hypothetical protein
LFSEPEPPFFLKGGYAMELRMSSSRATRDMDLTYLRRLNSPREVAAYSKSYGKNTTALTITPIAICEKNFRQKIRRDFVEEKSKRSKTEN